MNHLQYLLLVMLFSCFNGSQKKVDQAPKQNSENTPSNLSLYISNQSGERPTVDLEISIDDKVIISQDFDFGTGHNRKQIDLNLPEGKHRLAATSKAGKAYLKDSFDLTDRLWILVEYYYSSGGKNGIQIEPMIKFQTYHEPINFR